MARSQPGAVARRLSSHGRSTPQRGRGCQATVAILLSALLVQGPKLLANGDGWPGLPGCKLILLLCWQWLLSLVIIVKHFFLHIMARSRAP